MKPRRVLVAHWFAALLLVPAASPPASGRDAETARLANGATFVALSDHDRTDIDAEIAVGSADDPPGREGLAELTARSLVGPTQVHLDPAEVPKLLADAADQATLAVGPTWTRISLRGVKDVEAALHLLVEILALPRFSHVPTVTARTALASERVLQARSAAARVNEARRALQPLQAATPWTVLALEPKDAQEFHGKWYRPDGLTVVVSTAAPPSGAALTELAERTVGTWVARPDGPPTPAVLPVPAHRVVTQALSGVEPGVSLGFAVPASGGAAAAVALLAAVPAGRTGPRWVLDAAAATSAGAVAARGGTVMVMDASTVEPRAAAALFLGRLERLGRRGIREAHLREVVTALSAPPSEPGLAFLETRSALAERGGATGLAGAPKLETITAGDVRAAAAELLAGSRSEIHAGDVPAAVAGMAGKTSRDQAGPAAAPEVEQGRAWIARAVAAHGGDAFLALRGLTSIGQRARRIDAEIKAVARDRLDIDVSSLVLRHEIRHVLTSVAAQVLTFDGATAMLWGGPEPTPQPPLGSMSTRVTYFRHPVVILQRAAAPGALVRLKGVGTVRGRPVHVVDFADLENGLTELSIDDETAWLVRVSYRNRFPNQSASRDMTVELGKHAAVGAVVLPRLTETTTGGDANLASLDDEIEWFLHDAGWNPLEVVTDPNDLAKVGAPGASGGADGPL